MRFHALEATYVIFIGWNEPLDNCLRDLMQNRLP